ncbi:MAG: tetratricopeptide repeat protein [Myxococcota bacterium]|nr:tetratricopeptide repeat protein [Myxococcota bacterium]
MIAGFGLTLCAVLSQAAPPLPPPAVAGEGAAQAFGFAQSLLAEGDHYRAIGEYKRSLFLDPQGTDADAARMAIGLAYLRGGQAEAAALHYRQAALEVSESVRPEAQLQEAYARYVGSQPVLAYETFNRWLTRWEERAPPASRHRARYLLAWTELELGRDTEAAANFARAEFDRKPQLLQAVRGFGSLPQKSPLLAGVLSIIPGAGHVYIEQPLIGLTALLWNGLFAYALYEAISQRQLGIAITLGLFESLWYSGAIFGAVNGAMKFNRDARRNALDDLRQRFDDRPESWPPAPPRPAE